MARTSTITFDQVAAAAESIQAAGERPTARRIRDALGTGSMATILKFFQQWQGKNVDGEKEEIEVDPAIIKAIGVSVAAQVAANRTSDENRIADLKKEIAALIQENERQADLIERLEKESEFINMELAARQGKLEEANKNYKLGKEDHRKELEHERNMRASAERDCASMAARVSEMEKQLEDNKSYVTLLLEGKSKLTTVEPKESKNPTSAAKNKAAVKPKAKTSALPLEPANG